MSFILDALRRAQHAHQHTTVESAPIYADRVPDAPIDFRRRTAWLLGAIATLGVVAAAAWWFGRSSVTAPPEASPAPPAATAPPRAASTAPKTDGPRPPVRALDQEVSRGRPAAAPPPAQPSSTRSPSTASGQNRSPGTRVTPGTVTIVPAPNAAAPAPRADEGDTVALPQYENLLVEGAINLPNLKMDMHVYNRTPSKRFVFINFKKYREGDALDRQTNIEEITTTGAVMNHNGQRFLLRPN